MNSRRLGMEGFFIPRRYPNRAESQVPIRESCRISTTPADAAHQRDSPGVDSLGGESLPRTPKIRSRMNSTMM